MIAPRCLNCRAEIAEDRCPCSESVEVADEGGLRRGLLNAVLIVAVLYGGIGLAYVVVGNWGR